MIGRNVIHTYSIHGNIRCYEDKYGEERNQDRLFDVLNDTDNLPIRDIVIDNRNNIVNVYLTDSTSFSVHVEKCGIWNICEV